MIKPGDIQRYMQMQNQYKGHLIINPIMAGGIVPEEVQKRISKKNGLKSVTPYATIASKADQTWLQNPP